MGSAHISPDVSEAFGDVLAGSSDSIGMLVVTELTDEKYQTLSNCAAPIISPCFVR